MQTAVQIQIDGLQAIPTTAPEHVARPSQLANLGFYVWTLGKMVFATGVFYKLHQRWDLSPWFLAVPLFVWAYSIGRCYLQTRALSFEIDPERITWHAGVIGRTSSTIEICRIQSVTMHQGPLERIFGIGTVHIDTVDPVHSWVRMPGMQRPDELRRFLVHYTQVARKNRGNQEFYAL